MSADLPILYSFRRCPYAMRARLALASANIKVEHREVLLRDKPAEMLTVSSKGTVPVLIIGTEKIDESLDIMIWALTQNDPEGWLDIPAAAHDLIARCDGPFKTSLDHYKYSSRHPDRDKKADRDAASEFLFELDNLLVDRPYLYDQKPTLPDMAIATFVRQFAHVDLDWFGTQSWVNLANWLQDFKESARFRNIMTKHPLWAPGVQNLPA